MWLLDWMFPPQCAACGGHGAPLCEACAGSLVELGPCCPKCAEPGEGMVCGRCRASPLPLETIVSPWKFGGPLASAIRKLKFTGANHVARTVAPLWAPLVAAAVGENGVVVPVPLHWRRRFMRGYDHAFLLAVYACKTAKLDPPVPALARTRHGKPQSKLAASERRTNLRGAFRVLPRYATKIVGREVVLLDDVVTTGSTFAAATEALLANGARSVTGVALARAGY
ncbi:MAG: ComF family protein [Kofleriaceae bacterium]